jgi:hypothetical protein
MPLTDEKNVSPPPRIHLATDDGSTVCRCQVPASLVGQYVESLTIVNRRVLIRRAVYVDSMLVKRNERCSVCFRRHERML